MVNGIWNSLTQQSGVLATWIAAIVAFLGLAGVLFQMRAARRSALFGTLQQRFNEPAMLFSRAAFAWKKLNPKEPSSLHSMAVPLFGWEIANFLNSVGRLVEDNEVEFEDIETAFARHVLAVLANPQWKGRIDSQVLTLRFMPLLNLERRIIESGRFVDSADKLKAGAYDEAFWYSEVNLAPEAQVEEAVKKIREERANRLNPRPS